MTNIEALTTISQTLLRTRHADILECSDAIRTERIMRAVWDCKGLLKVNQTELLTVRDELFRRYGVEAE